MKKSLFILLTLLFCFPLLLQAKEIKLGEELTLTELTKVSEINKEPQKYIGKRVLVEGVIIDVCARRGCWVDISSDLPFDKIKVKVVDGVIVFPLEAKGRVARVEGEVEELKLSKDQALRMARHHAEEQGKSFDPGSIEGPQTIYRIRGIGAVIN